MKWSQLSVGEKTSVIATLISLGILIVMIITVVFGGITPTYGVERFVYHEHELDKEKELNAKLNTGKYVILSRTVSPYGVRPSGSLSPPSKSSRNLIIFRTSSNHQFHVQDAELVKRIKNEKILHFCDI